MHGNILLTHAYEARKYTEIQGGGGGVFFKAYGLHALRTFPLIFSILFPSASCWKALTCCPVVQAYHAAWVLDTEGQTLCVTSGPGPRRYKQVMVLDEFDIHPAKESEVRIVDWERSCFLTKYYML